MSENRLTLNEYAHRVAQFRRTDHDTWNENVCHILLGIAGEAGEIMDEIKKPMFSNRPDLPEDKKQISRVRLTKEIGDIMFYLTWLCDVFMIDPDEVLEQNIFKLAGRYHGPEEEKS